MSTNDTDSPHSNGDKPSIFDRLKAVFSGNQPTNRSDIEEALEGSSKESLSAQERRMLKSVLGLHEWRVRDIMVPRADIIAVALEDSLKDVLDVFRTAGHSRLPVYESTLDDPRGMIHIRDFMTHITAPTEALKTRGLPDPKNEESADFSGEKSRSILGEPDMNKSISQTRLLRTVLFVPPSMPILDLLRRMQAERIHMALVIDEYGGTDGLVSIEDVVEVIVGDIEDEHDEDESPRIEPREDGAFIIDGRAALSDVSEKTGINFNEWADTELIDTVAGLVSTIAGRVPSRGEVIPASAQWEFQILDADPRKIKLIALKRIVSGKDASLATAV